MVSLDRLLGTKKDDGSYSGAPSNKMGLNQLQQKGMPHSHLSGWISSMSSLATTSRSRGTRLEMRPRMGDSFHGVIQLRWSCSVDLKGQRLVGGSL